MTENDLIDNLRRRIKHNDILWNAEEEYFYGGIYQRELSDPFQQILSRWLDNGDIVINGKFVEFKKDTK